MSDELVEPVPGARGLCGHVTAIVGIYGGLDRHPADNLNANFGEAVELGRVVGEQDRLACI